MSGEKVRELYDKLFTHMVTQVTAMGSMLRTFSRVTGDDFTGDDLLEFALVVFRDVDLGVTASTEANRLFHALQEEMRATEPQAIPSVLSQQISFFANIQLIIDAAGHQLAADVKAEMERMGKTA